MIDRLGDGFSEVYFDNTDGMHVVAISSRGSRERADQAMADLADSGDPSVYKVGPVEHSRLDRPIP